ncbi:MAG: DUF1501 domain-containing protein [Planctomycetaceae bacterium]|jgi:hypothetical protein|nr:DUF1501 domain-containing protein [Planctomycetaceae bacterium]
MRDKNLDREQALHARRDWLNHVGMGVGAIALRLMLSEESAKAEPPVLKDKPHRDLLPRPTHFAPKAKAMISLFQHGGPSHMDLTDPKPELTKFNGTDYQGEVGFSFVNQASKKLLGSPFAFAPRGNSGIELSELLPHTSGVVDELCLIRSMHTGNNGHEVSIRYFHAGIPGILGRPTLGAWLTYALGSESQDLPAYMVLSDPGGHPVDGVTNWSNGFMPSLFQGTVLRPKEPRIFNLQPPAHLAGEMQQQNLQLLQELNRQHTYLHPNEPELFARMATYELAAKMQLAATDALDISKETEATLKLYGIDEPETQEYGTRCLLARRLVERGVRFVQLFHSGQPWDNHDSIAKNLPAICRRTDKPVAGLVADLKQRGLLDTTLVHWGGEIGRLPVTQEHGSPDRAGRDHNGQGFSIWMAGGGVRGGLAYGKTDEFGHKAVENIVTPNDFQATVMHLFGLEHERVYYPQNNSKQILTSGRPARVVKEILA